MIDAKTFTTRAAFVLGCGLLAACGGTTTSMDMDDDGAEQRAEDAVALINRVSGDIDTLQPGLPAAAISDVPTSGAAVFEGIGALNYYTRTSAGGLTTDTQVFTFLGDAELEVTFGATPVDTNITGDVTNIIATDENDTLVDVTGFWTVNSGRIGTTSSPSTVSLSYESELLAFGRPFNNSGVLRGLLRTGGDGDNGRALDAIDRDTPVGSDIEDLFVDIAIVAEN
ncbi:hypothetical protein [Yoonia sp. 208BN28-4]|uniref:hypothetical protein n=1 Tax=Yoonia sp. 208BN28-4 TaxID=3126505 RepID=UPI0030EB921D